MRVLATDRGEGLVFCFSVKKGSTWKSWLLLGKRTGEQGTMREILLLTVCLSAPLKFFYHVHVLELTPKINKTTLAKKKEGERPRRPQI